MIAAIIVAAGRGSRAGSADAPKQYVALGGQAILARSLAPFLRHSDVDLVQVVIHPDDRRLYDEAIAAGHAKLAGPVMGGATRQASVRLGLEAVGAHAPDHVLIHDAARPFVDEETISAVLAPLAEVPGAIVALGVTDTLKRQGPGGNIEATVARQGLWRALTPQAFRFGDIDAAHKAAQACGRDDFTDDASIAEFAGLAVALVEGRPDNIKITTPGDFVLAERLLPARAMEVCVGQGYDVHRFAPGDHVCLCGIDIPHSQRLDGHSDADVAMHALTDAILGAIGDGDIGQHFPPSDARWRGAASHVFLADALRRTRDQGGRIGNVDVTIVCEEPKIGPHRAAMRARLAEILELDIARVGVKATTSEELGFTGRREGIAALASATVLFGS